MSLTVIFAKLCQITYKKSQHNTILRSYFQMKSDILRKITDIYCKYLTFFMRNYVRSYCHTKLTYYSQSLTVILWIWQFFARVTVFLHGIWSTYFAQPLTAPVWIWQYFLWNYVRFRTKTGTQYSSYGRSYFHTESEVFRIWIKHFTPFDSCHTLHPDRHKDIGLCW